MGGDHGGPVVVAVGHDTFGQALDWAAAEASARACSLHVVHAERLRWAVDPSGLIPVADFSFQRAAAESLLEAAVGRARSVAPDVDVSAGCVVGPTVPLLLSRARGAQLLVLGSRIPPFPRGLRGVLAPSTCDRIAGRAPCPVAVVRPLRSGHHAGASPRVVVGVDGSGAGSAALHVAFRAAAQRGVPLSAVHVRPPTVRAGREAAGGSAAAPGERATPILDRTLEVWRDRFPDVPVETRLLVGDPAAALVRESEGASLTVVGSRGRGRVRTTAFGSVSRDVAQRARCPVVVVPTGKAEQDEGVVHDRRRRDLIAGGEPARQWRTPWQ